MGNNTRAHFPFPLTLIAIFINLLLASMANPNVQAAIAGQLLKVRPPSQEEDWPKGMRVLKVAEKVEEDVDAEMRRLETLDEDGLEAIRRQRIDQMKRLKEKKEVRPASVAVR